MWVSITLTTNRLHATLGMLCLTWDELSLSLYQASLLVMESMFITPTPTALFPPWPVIWPAKKHPVLESEKETTLWLI